MMYPHDCDTARDPREDFDLDLVVGIDRGSFQAFGFCFVFSRALRPHDESGRLVLFGDRDGDEINADEEGCAS